MRTGQSERTGFLQADGNLEQKPGQSSSRVVGFGIAPPPQYHTTLRIPLEVAQPG